MFSKVFFSKQTMADPSVIIINMMTRIQSLVRQTRVANYFAK